MRRQKQISCHLPSVCRSGDRVNPLGEHRLQGSGIATMIACSSMERTVDLACLGPVGRSAAVSRCFWLLTGLMSGVAAVLITSHLGSTRAGLSGDRQGRDHHLKGRSRRPFYGRKLFGGVRRPLHGLGGIFMPDRRVRPRGRRLSLESIPLRLGLPPSKQIPEPGRAIDIRTRVKERQIIVISCLM